MAGEIEIFNQCLADLIKSGNDLVKSGKVCNWFSNRVSSLLTEAKTILEVENEYRIEVSK